LKFHCDSQIELAGGDMPSTLDGVQVPMWQTVNVRKGQVLKCGKIATGCRTYIGIKSGLNVPEYLGSQATFTLGLFGGHAGRNLLIGDMLPITAFTSNQLKTVSEDQIPTLSSSWQIAEMYGPHAPRDFFTKQDIHTFS